MTEIDRIGGWELIEQRPTVDNSIVVRQTEARTVFLVKVIQWHGPSRPIVYLEEARIVNDRLDKQAIRNTKAELLELEEYFRVCVSCQRRTHAGYCMDDAAYCMACAQMELDIVF